jgi:hypothetical protein
MPKYHLLLIFFLISIASINSKAGGEAIVRKRALDPNAFLQKNLLTNPQLEEGDPRISGWRGWGLGYEEKPIPILAQCLSKAENVSGTHDWEKGWPWLSHWMSPLHTLPPIIKRSI